MLEATESLLPLREDRSAPSVLILGFEPEEEAEMRMLLATLDVERMEVKSCGRLRRVSPRTYLGEGKILEAKLMIEAQDLDAVVIDAELSPNQLKNLEKELGKPTLDRPGVIIEIFSRNARSKEAKTQVELARLKYLLPRLAHYWNHFERQRGGTGNRGMGESQLEVDRRLLKNRIQTLTLRLAEIKKERQLARSGRADVLKVALVGYTNAGKSTLLNALTDSTELAQNKLFSTLDSRVRSLDPNSHPPIVAIDTVGFIRKIPTHLVASFRSTLEELGEADLLLHVVDASSPEAKTELETTEAVLKDLDLGEKPKMVILNKIDLVSGVGARNLARVICPGGMLTSALDPVSVNAVRQAIQEYFRNHLEVWEVLIPYTQSKLEAQMHRLAHIERHKYLEQGAFYRIRIAPGVARKLQLEQYRTTPV